MIFIVLSSLETVHVTIEYRYCIFSLLNRLLRIRLKHQESFTYLRERERMYTVNVQCNVQYTLLLLYLIIVLFYSTVIYQLKFTVFMYVTQISHYM
jgi:hypothetical protein